LAPRALIIIWPTLGFGLIGSQSTFEDSCGAYCKARQVRDISHEAVALQGLKGHERNVESENCIAKLKEGYAIEV
jgi:hypothetical protein